MERKPIVYLLPAGAQEGWVQGSLSFPPASLPAPSNLRLVDRNGAEIAARVSVSKTWFDGSVMLVEIGFMGTKERERSVWIEWDGGIAAGRRLSLAPAAAGALFQVVDEAGDLKVKGEVDVGTLVVRVEKHAALYYYWYLVPLTLILGALLWRKYRLRRKVAA